MGREEALQCWSEGRDDEEKMHECMADTILTWNAVLARKDGLKCLFAAKDNTAKIRECKSLGTTVVEANIAEQKASGATTVTINLLLGASLVILLLVRASNTETNL